MILKLAISSLREMVKKKQEYLILLGQEEFSQLYKRYKNFDLRYIDSVTAHGQRIDIGDVELRDTIKGKCVSISPFCNNLGIQKTNITFYEKDISWQNIVDRINEWERKTISLRKTPLSTDDLEPRSLNKLFSKKYNPIRRIDEKGRPVTTIIDKNTQEPVEAYIVSSENINSELFEMYIKNNNGADELIGFRSFKPNDREKIISPGYMKSLANDRYEGIGIRLHQLAIERMIQYDYKAVEICSLDIAFPFHYKSLFRAKPEHYRDFDVSVAKNIKEQFKRIISGKVKISDEEIDKCFIKADENSYFDFSKTIENFHKLFFRKHFTAGGDTPMVLDGKNLEYWKSLIAKQPILLNL